jgi:adenine-specific DNA-methyltransferase
MCDKLFSVPGRTQGIASIPPEIQERLRLERWADDLKNGLEREIRDLDIDIRSARRDARVEASLEATVAAQRRIGDLEADRNRKRRALFEAQDNIDHRKGQLITQVEARLRQRVAAGFPGGTRCSS